jgi:hypothetical protein
MDTDISEINALGVYYSEDVAMFGYTMAVGEDGSVFISVETTMDQCKALISLF